MQYELKTDRQPTSFRRKVDERALSQHIDEIDTLCHAAGVASLSEFVTVAGDDLEDYFDQDSFDVGHVDGPIDADDVEDGAWFSGAEGLEVIDPVLAHVAGQDDASEFDDVITTLRDLRDTLEDIRRRGLHWHLTETT
ncbi:MAG: hypothetical protein AAGN46_03815 [Acidobacteriota bacterium]